MSRFQVLIFLQKGDHRECWLWPILMSLLVPGWPGLRGKHMVVRAKALELS